MIKAVVFDYGNVISLPNAGESFMQMEKLAPVSPEVYKTYMDFFRDEFDLGLISGAELYSKIYKKAGYETYSADKDLCARVAKLDMDGWSAYSQEVSNWALSLRKEGFILGVLSNMPYEFLEFYEKDIPVFTQADKAVFSCRERLIKPDPAIYRVLLDRLGTKPEETVFFDDLQRNIDAANALGIHGIIWKNLEEAQAEFQKLLRG